MDSDKLRLQLAVLHGIDMNPYAVSGKNNRLAHGKEPVEICRIRTTLHQYKAQGFSCSGIQGFDEGVLVGELCSLKHFPGCSVVLDSRPCAGAACLPAQYETIPLWVREWNRRQAIERAAP